MPSAVERSGAARASGTGAKPGVEQAPSPVPSAIAPRPAPPSPRRNPRRFTGGGSLVIAAPHQAEHGPAVPQPVAGGGLAAFSARGQPPGGAGATVRGRPRLPPSTSVTKSHVLITLQRSWLPSPRAVPGEDRAGIRTTDAVSDARRTGIGVRPGDGPFSQVAAVGFEPRSAKPTVLQRASAHVCRLVWPGWGCRSWPGVAWSTIG